MRRWTLFHRAVSGAPSVPSARVSVDGPDLAGFEEVEVVPLSEVREALLDSVDKIAAARHEASRVKCGTALTWEQMSPEYRARRENYVGEFLLVAYDAAFPSTDSEGQG